MPGTKEKGTKKRKHDHAGRGGGAAGQETPSSTDGDTIPLVIVLRAFKFLALADRHATCAVCRQFDRACKHKSLRGRLDLCAEAPRLRDPLIVHALVKRCARHLTLLRVGVRPRNALRFARLLSRCQRLRHLELRGAAASASLVSALAPLLGPIGADVPLETLALFGPQLTGSALVTMCQAQPALRELALGGTYRVGEGDLNAALAGCAKTLETLELRDMPNLTDAMVAHLGSGREVRTDADRRPSEWPGLTALRVCRCPRLTGQLFALRSQGTEGGFPAWVQRLVELDIADCAQLDDTMLIHIARTACSALRVLKLRSLPRISGVGIEQLGSACFAGTLEKLDLTGCSGICDGAAGAVDVAFPALRTLSLSGCDVSDLGVQLLGTTAKNLQELELHGCDARRVTKIALLHLALGPLGARLRRVTLPRGKDGLYAGEFCVPFDGGNCIELLRRVRAEPSSDESDCDSDGDAGGGGVRKERSSVSFTFPSHPKM